MELININDVYKKNLVTQFVNATKMKFDDIDGCYKSKEFLLWIKKMLINKQSYVSFLLNNSSLMNCSKGKKLPIIELNNGKVESISSELNENRLKSLSVSKFYMKDDTDFGICGDIKKLNFYNKEQYALDIKYDIINLCKMVPRFDESNGIFTELSSVDNSESAMLVYKMNNISIDNDIPFLIGVYGSKDDEDADLKIERLKKHKESFIKFKVDEYSACKDNTYMYFIEKQKTLKK